MKIKNYYKILIQKRADLGLSFSKGDKIWYRNGHMHRDGGPAVEYVRGLFIWFQNGLRHRDDGPALEYNTGYKEWWKDGKFICDDY